MRSFHWLVGVFYFVFIPFYPTLGVIKKQVSAYKLWPYL